MFSKFLYYDNIYNMKSKKLKIIMILISIAIILIIVYFSVPHKVIIFNKEYKSNITYLDLSKENIDNNLKWINKLENFSKLKTIDFKDKLLPEEIYQKLLQKYPRITIKAIITYNLYNQILREDISELNLCDTDVDKNIITNISLFSKLNKIDFCENAIDNEIKYELINKYPNINYIWNVQIGNLTVKNDITYLDLSKLTLDYNKLKKELSLLPKLQKLEISDTNLKNEELADLRNMYPNIKIVWKIYLGQWNLKTDDIAFSVLVNKINYKRLTTEDIEVLKYCTDLQALDLGHQAITDISVIGKYLTNLRILILADNKINDITPLSNLKHLHYVELFVNKIKDFSPLEKCTELIDVNIGYNPKIDNIEPLLHFKNLERLWIVSAGLTNEQMNTLRNNYPNSNVNLWWALTSTGNGWRTHPRYYAMIDMFHKKNYISEEFCKYDNI